MSGYKWVKVYTSILEESRFMRLPDVDKLTYFLLILLAGRAGDGGKLTENGEPMDADAIAWSLRANPGEVIPRLERLKEAGFLEYRGGCWALPRWADEQVDIEKRRAEIRQRVSRFRKKAEAQDADGTAHDVTRSEESRVEEIKNRVEVEVDKNRGNALQTRYRKEQKPPQTATDDGDGDGGASLSLSLKEKVRLPLMARDGEVDEESLESAVIEWAEESRRRGWNFDNVGAVLERYERERLAKRKGKTGALAAAKARLEAERREHDPGFMEEW